MAVLAVREALLLDVVVEMVVMAVLVVVQVVTVELEDLMAQAQVAVVDQVVL